jgi:hypothetical protein
VTDLALVNTCVDEGLAFDQRHRDDLNKAQRAMGALTWGLWRALAECPICGKGHFRVPCEGLDAHDQPFEGWYCHMCKNAWKDVPAEPVKKKRARQGRLAP